MPVSASIGIRRTQTSSPSQPSYSQSERCADSGLTGKNSRASPCTTSGTSLKTDQWGSRIIRLGRQIQHVLHSRHQLGIDGGQTPLLMLPRFQSVFLRNWRTVSGEMPRTSPTSTAWPASLRTVQWSCPSGTSLQAIAMRWAACSSVSAWRRRLDRLSVSTASTPPVSYRCRTLRIVWSEISKASAIWSLLQPSSPGEQHPCTHQGACIGFAASHKHFSMCSFVTASVDRSRSFHENFSLFPQLLTTIKLDPGQAVSSRRLQVCALHSQV